MKKVLLALTLVAFSATTYAQSSSLSPYGMYGPGMLCDQSNSASRSMGGVAQGFREGNQLNFLNPASYSNVDSLSFIFDIGMSLDRTIFTEGGRKTTGNAASFEYIIAGFRAYKHVGVSFGLVPLTNMDYNFSSSKPMSDFVSYPYTIAQNQVTATTLYGSEGGSREVFLGAGWEIFKGFSLGFNAMYLWGKVDRELGLYYSDSSIKKLYKTWNQQFSKFTFSVGAQYSYDLGKRRSITLGATYTPKVQLGNGDATEQAISYNTADADTTNFIAAGGYYMPAQISAGIAYKQSNWKVGVDYTLQQWSDLPNTPFIQQNGTKIEGKTGEYNDRHTFKIGGEWCKNPMGRSYFDRVKFRAGFSYSTPHLKLNTYSEQLKGLYSCNGPREISATLGAALPIINTYNNRSVLNIGFQWVNESGSLIDENTFRINLSLTFNERWFAKWKFE